MNADDPLRTMEAPAPDAHDAGADPSPSTDGRREAPRIDGVVVGELLALADEGRTPLVRFAGQVGTAAQRARTTIDLQGPHIGAEVLLLFESGDPTRPIIVGLLRGADSEWSGPEIPAQVSVDADGARMIVSAREQLVLRCGDASITLTKAGKVLIEGSFLLSRSTGVNRIKGGSVLLN